MPAGPTATLVNPAGGQAGDLIIACVGFTEPVGEEGGTINANDAGWTTLVNDRNTFSSIGEDRLAIFYRIDSGSEPGSYSFTADPADPPFSFYAATIFRYRNADATPIDASNPGLTIDSTSDTSPPIQGVITLPSLTATKPGKLIAVFYGRSVGEPPPDIGFTTPTGMSSLRRVDDQTQVQMFVADENIDAGATGTRSSTYTFHVDLAEKEVIGYMFVITS